MPHEPLRAHAHTSAAADGRQHTCRSRGAQPVQLVGGCIGRRLRRDGRDASDQVVQAWHFRPFSTVRDSRRQERREHAVGPAVDGRLDVGLAPRSARTRRAAGTAPTPTKISQPSASAGRQGGRLVTFKAHDGLRRPQLEHEHHHDDARERAHDVGQLRPEVVRHVELHARERDVRTRGSPAALRQRASSRPSRRSDSRG